jgi:PAS domain S-box-containing protein
MIPIIARMLGLAAAYYIAGRLGLLLAVPPGYATPVWPPAGLALAGLLLFGYRVWPGVFLGSFLVNLTGVGGPIHADALLRSGAVAGWIAAGATLEACLGAVLIRWLVGFPTALDEARDVALFLVLGGPAAGVLNATWSVTALAFQGVVPWPAYPFNWLTWWAGDAMGVLVFAPLALMCLATPREAWRVRLAPVGIPLLAAFALSIVMFTKVSAWEQDAARFDFEGHADDLAATFRSSLDRYLEVLNSVGSLFASADVDRQAFDQFVGRELLRHPGIKALEWIPRVPAANRGVYERAARDDGYWTFAIHDTIPGGRVVIAGARDEYFPVYFVDPYRGNEAALGFDLASDPVRRAALIEARDSGDIVASGRITLVQETGRSFGVLLFAPVYHRNAPVSTLAARREQLLGFGLLVLRMKDFADATFPAERLKGLQVRVEDDSSPPAERLLWASSVPAPRDTPADARASVWRTYLPVGGRRWALVVTRPPGLGGAERSWQPWALLTLSLLFTGVMGALLLIATGRALKTARLATENAKLYGRYRSLFEEVPAGLYRASPEGELVDVNTAFLRMLGYPNRQALGAATAVSLYVDPAVREQWQVRLEQDGVVTGLECELKCHDGTRIWVQTNARAVRDSAGRVVAYEGAVVDITERKQAAARQEAAAAENARLYEEVLRRSSQLQALREIDQAITGSLDLSVSLDVVLTKAITELQVDAACVLLLHPHLQALECATAQGFRTIVLRNLRIALGEGLAGRVALERQRMGIADLAAVPDPLVMLRQPQGRREGFRTTYATPLIAKGQILGVLQVFFRRLAEPGEEWLEFLDTLAGQTAIAISDARQVQALQRSNDDLLRAYDTTLAGWARALELRDKETGGHTQRVADLTVRLAAGLRVGDADLVNVRRGALLHDIGKMGVPDSVLLKPGPLSTEERRMIEMHPVHAYELLAPIEYLRGALDIPYCHHERWDGTGYPRGLRGTDIPLAARIFAVVDVWDALTSPRPYRAAWNTERARRYIKERTGTQFDPDVVDAFLGMLEEDQSLLHEDGAADATSPADVTSPAGAPSPTDAPSRPDATSRTDAASRADATSPADAATPAGARRRRER